MERIRMKPIVKTFQDKRRRLVTNQKLGNKGNHRLLKKPSIKITVSADVPSDLFSTKGIEGSPHVIKRILLDDSKYTRITVDNETVVDFPNCVDFGIRDFLCAYYEEEVEYDPTNSDTDGPSFLDATPPQRFSDSELDSQIEIMSVTLDSVLNLTKDDLFATKDDTFLIEKKKRIKHYVYENLGHINLPGLVDVGQANEVKDRRGQMQNQGQNQRRRKPPPRRQISLPASLFMSYLINSSETRRGSNFSERSETDSLDVAAINRKKSNVSDVSSISVGSGKSNVSVGSAGSRDEPGPGKFQGRKLSKIEGSYSSNESTETDGSRDGDPWAGPDCLMRVSSDDEIERDSLLTHCGGEDGPFTSEIERKSLVLRYMRKLVRQDTSGNFAPPDYCI